MSISDWSTSQTANQTADSEINWQEGQLPSTVNNSARAMMATLAAWRNDMGGAITAGGTADAITVTLEKPMTSAAYSFFSFIASATNTGAATLKVDSQSALPLRSVSGASLSAGQIRTGHIYHVAKGASGEWLVSNPGQGNADAAFMAANTVKANLTGASAAPTDSTVAALASLVNSALIPSGTRMIFAQSSAPTGWTKDTTHNDKALRVVSCTAGSGGSVAFTTAFAVKTVSGTVGGTALTIAQMPAHTHTIQSYRTSSARGDSGALDSFTGTATASYPTASQGSGDTHTHALTIDSVALSVSYVDVIIAAKD